MPDDIFNHHEMLTVIADLAAVARLAGAAQAQAKRAPMLYTAPDSIKKGPT